MPTIKINGYPAVCSRCKENFNSPFPPVKNKPIYCKKCTTEITTISSLERQLLKQSFSLEQEDENIARQINDLLTKEFEGNSEEKEKLISALTEKMIKDEKRRKIILKQILKLQKKKR